MASIPRRISRWKLFLLFPLLIAGRQTTAQTPARPFPQHVPYQPGTILPDHISRREMDDSVRSFYAAWKRKYLRTGCTNGEGGEYYIWYEGTTGSIQSVSEGQGYGMLIVALMAGADTLAQQAYNGLFRYYRTHRIPATHYLMAWAQDKNCVDLDNTSATDGDMDIAYSLLLADAQWGSKGPIDYRQEALGMIKAIRQQEINPVTFSVLLSNAVKIDSKDYFDMRSSDFMPAHLRAFRTASGDLGWDSAITANYRLFRYLEDQYSPEAGLLPDFINKIRITVEASPAHPHYLESRYDGYYNYNACRVPWRIATDYILHGDSSAAAICGKINRWIRSTTKNNPDNISSGYNLAGEDLPRRYFEALSFITPFAVSAMTNPDNQLWLNKLWDYIINFKLKEFDYYDNSIKMIGLLILSGNYWEP